MSLDLVDLHGRAEETSAIGRAVERTLNGQAGLLCLAGEPGIGKTSLLEVLAACASGAGMLVLRAGGAEFERGVPFGVFVDALDDHVATLAPASLAGLTTDHRRRLAPLLPALAAGDATQATPPGERHRTLNAMRALLETLAARRPVVLALDDLHWVDEASLELVTHLARRPPRARVLLALAYRPLQLSQRAGPRAAFIAEAADELVEPGPLGRADAAALVADRVTPGRLEALLSQSGGNPFYLEQLAEAERRARTSSGATTPPGLELGGVPRAVVGALAGELARLPDDVRAICLAAAVVGDPFEPHLVAAASGTSPEHTLAAIDTLVREGTARQADTPRRFRFRHPILRRAAYESAAPSIRLDAHRRLATLLARSGAPALEQAQHVEASAIFGDLDAVALLSRAGRDAVPSAPAIAARWYAGALRLAPTSYDPVERLGLLVALATAQGSAGLLDASRQTLLETLDALPEELAPLRERLVTFLALVGHMLGRHGEATALLRRALARHPDPCAPEAAELGIGTALDCLYEPDHPAMVRYAVDADRAARRGGDPALKASGAAALALARYNVGEVDAALGECDRATAAFAALSDGALAGRLEGMLALAWTAMLVERDVTCDLIAGRALAISRETGQGHLLVPLTVARTVATTWRGELRRAAVEADDLVDAARLTHVGQWLAWSLTLRGWIATLAGELDLAAGCGEEACTVAGTQERPTYFVAHSVLHLAETRLAQGRPEECLTTLVAAAGGPGLPVCEQPVRPRYYEILTRAALALGRQEEAADWALRAERSGAASPLSGRRCEALLARAAVLLAAGDHEGAEACTREAVPAAHASGHRLLAVRAQVLDARARAPRSRGEAIVLLEQARAEFERCGATRSHDDAVRELRRLGRRVRGGGRRGTGIGGAAALSRREREVAELVTGGLTNREIAARLVLSDRTIETHLAAIFRKLGIRGRAAVADALRGEA